MIEEIELYAVRKDVNSRKSWVCKNNKLGTVEEFAREYYLRERAFTDCLIDTSCVYGGLLWLLFHDILFHDNINSRHPLCAQFFHTPQRFYERYKSVIEKRLAVYQNDRQNIFDQKMQQFCAHPFFSDSRSKIAKYHGNWLLKNQSALREFACMSVEHDQESLIFEMIVSSYRGRSNGWPDLVAWSKKSLVFAEVKSTDKLSKNQLQWISDHERKYQIELVRILEE